MKGFSLKYKLLVLIRPILGVIILVLGAACSSSGTPSALTLTSSIPAAGASNIAINTKLTLVFSKEINQDSLQVSSSPAINLGIASWNDAKTAIFSPLENWKAGTSYTLSIQAKDSSGNAISKTLSFSTQAPTDTTAPGIPQNITATATNGDLSISWDANTETDLSGYTVFWGMSEDSLSPMSFVTKPGLMATFQGLEELKTYYYAVEALDTSNNASGKSAVASILMQDTLAPTLTNSEPANLSQGLSLVPKLRLTFSEAIQTDSLQITVCASNLAPADASCTPETAIKINLGTPSWNSSNTLAEYTTESAFQAGNTYVLLITAKDKGGNDLEDPTKVAFSLSATLDTTPPNLLSMGVFSMNNTTHVVPIIFSFSEAMDQKSVQDAFLSQPALNCSWTWEANQGTCSARVTQNTHYDIVIGTGAKDTANNAMVAAYSDTLDIGNLNPRVTSYSPTSKFGGAINVDVNSPIILKFSEPMNPSTTQGAFVVTNNSLAKAGEFIWNADATEMIFSPSSPYGYGQAVVWSLGTGATDSQGTLLAQAISSSFTTELLINP